LITAVEMADPRKAERYGYSQPMIDLTVRAAAEQVDRLDVAQVFDWRRLRRYAVTVVVCTLGIYLLLGSVYCLAARTRVGDYLGGSANVASIWFERNVLLADTLWPRKAYLELVNFPESGDLRVGRNASPPALHVRALKWVVADASAPEGWRALQWSDLSPQLLGVDSHAIPLPESWRQWPVDVIELQLDKENASLDPNTMQALRNLFQELEQKASSSSMARRLRKLAIPNQVVVYYRGETVRSEQTLKKQANNEYSGVLSDLKESVRFTANGEDYYTPYKKITLVPPPGLIELVCDEERPAYLYERPLAVPKPDLKGKKKVYKDSPISLASSLSRIDVAAGTNVVLRGRTDKLLRAADGIRMRPREGSAPIRSPVLPKDAQSFEVRFDDVSAPVDFLFEFTDTDNVVGQRHVVIKPTEDTPPDVDVVIEVIRKTNQGYLATPSARIPFSGKVRDDHGLNEVTYAYTMLALEAQATVAVRPVVSAFSSLPRGLGADLLATAYLVWLGPMVKAAAEEPSLAPEKKSLATFLRALADANAQDQPQEKLITNLTLDPEEEFFDVAQLGLKVGDDPAAPRYRLRLVVEALDSNVETGPGIGQSKERFTILLIPENELLVEIAKEEENLHVKLEDTVTRLKDARTKLDQVIQELPSLRAEEFSPLALRADEIRAAIVRSWDVSREVYTDYRKILKELQTNRVRPKIIEKVDRNICEPLDVAVNQEFARSEDSMTAFQKILDKEKKANLEAATLAHQQLDQVIERLSRVLDAMGDITTINKLIEQLVQIEKAERTAYGRFKEINDRLQNELFDSAAPDSKPEEKKP
jgi:hypothetical protein